MANTEVTKGNGGQLQRPTDIFSAMRSEMDRMFERFEYGFPRWPAIGRGFDQQALMPELDVHDNGKQLTIEVDLPGVEQNDVSITIADGLLTVKGEKKSEREEKKENYYVSERSYGSFERSLRLPDTIDESKVEARFDKGVLKVVAQKRADAETKKKRIEIKSS